MLVSRLAKIASAGARLLKTLAVIVPLLCAACLSATAQTTATIDTDTTSTTPVHPGFSGANSEIGFPIEDWDYRFNALAAKVGYGWLRFPGGNDGDAYNWQTGEEVASWVAQFSADPLGAQLPGALKNVAGKGGARLMDAANRANLLGAKLIVCANGFTDTPQSIGQLATYVKANRIPVAAWELANEAYLYPDFFPTATDYLDKMKPFRDAIKAVDPNAIVAIFARDPGNSSALNAWDAAVAAYPNKYWDAITFHHYPPQSSGNFAQWMADQNAVLVNKTTTVVTNQLTPIGPPGTKFIVTEFDPTLPVDKSTGVVSLTDGTLWGGIYAAEFIMRMSTVPSMLYVGPHAVNNVSGVNSTNNHYGDMTVAFNAGKTIDTTTLDFGFYLTAQANGLAVLNGVINHATQSNKTTVTGGATVPATGITAGVPALYAMSYTNATAGLSVVIANKSATAHQVTMRVDGAAVTGNLPLQFITGTDPSAANSLTTPNAVAVQAGNSGNPVTVGPYSVVRVDLMGTPFSDAGQSVAAGGSSGSINLTFPSGFSWTASSGASWLTITGSSAGTGSGTLHYQVAANTGGDRTATLTVAGFTFTIEQAGAAIPGLVPVGSLAQVNAEGGWSFELDAVNLGGSAATARVNFTDPNGNPLLMPLTFPQTSTALPELAATLDRSIAPNARIVIDSSGPASAPALSGSGQLLSDRKVGGFGIFSYPAFQWNAVVPLETRNASAYSLPFDNTGILATGVALASVSAAATRVNVTILNDAGAQIGTDTIDLAAQQYKQFLLDKQYPQTTGLRGTIQFQTPGSGQISVLGVRANGSALTTLPVLSNADPAGGLISDVTYNGGFTSTFYLVNTGSSPSPFTLSFFDQNGNPLTVPLSLPQSATSVSTAALTRTLAPGEMLEVATQAQAALANISGSAQLTTTGSVGGFEIFRWDTYGQEASVPLETRKPGSFVLVFDNTGGLNTGVALANAGASATSIAANIYDDQGNLLAAPVLNLAGRAQETFMLPANYPITLGRRGMVQFVVPPSGAISMIGIRTSGTTLTTVPILTK